MIVVMEPNLNSKSVTGDQPLPLALKVTSATLQSTIPTSTHPVLALSVIDGRKSREAKSPSTLWDTGLSAIVTKLCSYCCSL